ncbi:hypothetical protein EV421DRAFT_1820929 [Armillaria borealis]|uniref:Uncharacterized protein n=1 Tax=Armillaria borealis TaxID=47425 RepID=A0AA39JCA5_9AGAR|nr:hypothetical protein EV421DRAFT_1820929 [Armillaria borealis]
MFYAHECTSSSLGSLVTYNLPCYVFDMLIFVMDCLKLLKKPSVFLSSLVPICTMCTTLHVCSSNQL